MSSADEHSGEYHRACAIRIFGRASVPEIDIDIAGIEKGNIQLDLRGTMSGVQEKLSVSYSDKNPGRLTLVGLWGEFILKPASKEFPELPANEDLTMHLARVVGIRTAAHSLIRLTDGELAYLTRRFDRKRSSPRANHHNKLTKLHVEDMCQLSLRLTEDKYKGSIEQVVKRIQLYSSQPAFDLVALYELVLFCFLTGNADMHLKNWSLLRSEAGEYTLSPAYDLLSTKLVLPGDPEESALTMLGKKNKLARRDFVEFAQHCKIPDAVRNSLFKRLAKRMPALRDLIAKSFLSSDLRTRYADIIEERFERLGIA